eukprot:7211161-Prymnesium_polylepis.1
MAASAPSMSSGASLPFRHNAPDDEIRTRCNQLKVLLELYRPLSDGARVTAHQRAARPVTHSNAAGPTTCGRSGQDLLRRRPLGAPAAELARTSRSDLDRRCGDRAASPTHRPDADGHSLLDASAPPDPPHAESRAELADLLVAPPTSGLLSVWPLSLLAFFHAAHALRLPGQLRSRVNDPLPQEVSAGALLRLPATSAPTCWRLSAAHPPNQKSAPPGRNVKRARARARPRGAG